MRVGEPRGTPARRGRAFACLRFRLVATDPGVCLAHLAGAWLDAAPVPAGVELLVDDGDRLHTVAPLAAPRHAPAGEWLAGFRLPAAIALAPRSAFALAAGGAVIDLPRPWRSALPLPPPAPPRRASLAEELSDLGARLERVERDWHALDSELRVAELAAEIRARRLGGPRRQPGSGAGAGADG